eukprot:2735127-Amphidinium_carterae.1
MSQTRKKSKVFTSSKSLNVLTHTDNVRDCLGLAYNIASRKQILQLFDLTALFPKTTSPETRRFTVAADEIS